MKKNNMTKKMFQFIRKAFHTGLTILSSVNPLNATQLKCVSMNNQECKVRPDIFNVNSDAPVFYTSSIKTSAVVFVTISMIHTQKCVFLIVLEHKC